MGGPGYRIKGEFNANGVKNDLQAYLRRSEHGPQHDEGQRRFPVLHHDQRQPPSGRPVRRPSAGCWRAWRRRRRSSPSAPTGWTARWSLSASSPFAWRPTAWNIPLRSCKRFPAAEGQTPFRRLFSGNEMLKGFGPEGRKCHEIESSRSGAALPCWKRRSAPCRGGQRRGRGVSGNQSLWGPGFRCELRRGGAGPGGGIRPPASCPGACDRQHAGEGAGVLRRSGDPAGHRRRQSRRGHCSGSGAWRRWCGTSFLR